MLLAAPELKEIEFPLRETRTIARSKMPIQKEQLALDLAVNGYHAWHRLYDKMAGDLTADFEEGGEIKQLSMGQLATKMSSSDRNVRRRALEAMSGAWERRADLAAMALNAQGGFRLSLYKHRGWDSPLYEPLINTRLKEETLNAMWDVIAQEKKRLQRYLDAKMKLLGIDKNMWYDEFAPCGSSDTLYSFDDAGQFIIDNVRSFSDDMADFVRLALDNRWVEAEDRGDKAGGAFCTGFGPVRQSRVFMTYGGSFDNLLTLAHELGHAYHQQVISEKPYFVQQYPMPLAETASIFSETLVTDAALSQTTDTQERLMLLDQKLQRAYVMFTDLHCRYLFDKAFYAERPNGMIPVARLSEMMVEAQREAYAGMLDDSGYHPLFWASKLHFYITEAPFYNFPYTFGFLFSGGVYDRAQTEGKAFAGKYRQLLAETGSMQTEDLAKKHLDVDLTGTNFWKAAVDRALADIDDFVELTKGA
jgi:pepF/M3 family oligoendopeptidase